MATVKSSTNKEESRTMISDVCHDLEGLRQGQNQLAKQLDHITLALKALIDIQEEMNTKISAIGERCFQERATEPRNMPSEEPKAVADTTSSTAPYPQFDAGHRLTRTSELLEMVLHELPSEDILFAQRISRQFCSVIAGSRPLQLRLFFTIQPATPISTSIVLNPIMTQKWVLACIPIYFDAAEVAMAYCYRVGRKRVFCTKAIVERDQTTGQEWVHLKLTDSYFPEPLPTFDEPRRTPFGAGSWKRMCLSSSPCEVKWTLLIVGKYTEHKYSGTANSESTMDGFLDALAATSVVDEGESRRRPYV